MAEPGLQETVHAAALSLERLQLEVYSDPSLSDSAWVQSLTKSIETLWPHFLRIATAEGVFDVLPVDIEKQELEVELTWTANGMIQGLNRDYRQKDSATDVLSFTLLADAEDRAPWLNLPVLQLGSIFISLEWAEAAVREQAGLDADRYVLERFVHGMLHLLGMHHDTMPDYERVVVIQKRVLAAALGPAL